MKLYIKPLKKEEINKYLQITDLTLDENHVIGIIYNKIKDYIESTHPNSEILVSRLNPIVPVADNYDRLRFSEDNIGRSSTYTQYVDYEHMLRAHTTAGIPNILRKLSMRKDWNDVIILLPGLVYHRDIADKKHLAVLHQLDIWRVVKNSKRKKIVKDDLLNVIKGIATLLAPNWKIRAEDRIHPYTHEGSEINLVKKDQDIELLEGGIIHSEVLRNEGLDPECYSGWASGMGLDRMAMIVKDIPDIRYLRSENPRIQKQMSNLNLYKDVSLQPAIKRDLSYSVPEEYVEEDISEDIRIAMGDYQSSLENVEIVDHTNYDNLSEVVRKKLGCSKGQKNILVRITLRNLERTLTKHEANDIYRLIYEKVNYGSKGYM